MEEYEIRQHNVNGLINSVYNNIITAKKQNDNRKADNVHMYPLIIEKQEDEHSSPPVSRATATRMPKNIGDSQQYTNVQENNIREISTEPFCHVKVDSIVKLKDSTKKLLYLVQEIQSKTQSKHINYELQKCSDPDRTAKPSFFTDVDNSETDLSPALKRLEIQTKILDTIPTPAEDDDCSIFKKLTRKCNCLNQKEYNDFVIHFNEATKYNTSRAGEIIKNMRIIKKFLYMGDDYTKNALLFLNEGLSGSPYAEKIEIVQGCSYADICNVFENVSLVITCIAWPYKYDSYGDTITQELAAEFINKLAQVEEGRRYLKFTSKITNDIKKVLTKKGSELQVKTLESLHSALNEINSTHDFIVNDTYNSRPVDEGFGQQTMNALINHKQYMTLSEIFTHLDLLIKWSVVEKGITELKRCQKALLDLFKDLLVTYDDSEMNILIADILNNLISKSMFEEKDPLIPKIITIVDTSTEAVQMRSKAVQNSIKKKIIKKNIIRPRRRNRSNAHLVKCPLYSKQRET